MSDAKNWPRIHITSPTGFMWDVSVKNHDGSEIHGICKIEIIIDANQPDPFKSALRLTFVEGSFAFDFKQAINQVEAHTIDEDPPDSPK